MSQVIEPAYTTEPEGIFNLVKFVGGTTAATLAGVGANRGFSIAWISTGLYEITWGEYPGNFVGCFGHCFEATTASAVKGFTAVVAVMNATTLKLRVSVTNASEALTDLAALQWLSLALVFKKSGSGV